HKIEIECPENIEVFGNRKELVQVFKQLFENACLYSPEGGDISASVSQDEEQTVISVEDHGIGIPEHELKSIFEPFHRLDTGDTRSTGGVGLGLSVTREIVSLHGGKIEVRSTEGLGSTFNVTLPTTTLKTTDESS
ncbi:MAG: PAS domain-containing sensor histidine kinase, partial [Gammaproteobacteria bacterium]|nr:PAS domain-containing sensor histidine kinase [Gammaproteobacteria bacterium]NIR92197.1 PAS domain-containing sensor histidine kinase [Gammaproteobacteria bacterium]NIW43413.1 PAS domain-containing sensor histidine kinase [Gammaproteobacteria bacterium]NIW97451.1 PAS domain-containing sensor histidine kinase [Phycisphaerae bacterium]